MPALAKITWQDHRPFNLYTYKWNKRPFNLPIAIFDKIIRTVSKKKYVQRNWELQFIGQSNDEQLRKRLFDNHSFQEFVPSELVASFYNKFKNDNPVTYSHPVSILLTLSLFSKLQQ
jgi:hypothetical protein